MAFSRDDLAAYEKGAATPAPAAPVQDPAPPASASPAQAADPSAAAPVTDPAVPDGDATSAVDADSAPANADPSGDTATDDPPAAPAAPAPKGSARERIEGLIIERDALRGYGEHVLSQNAELKARLAALEARLGGPAVADAIAPAAAPASAPAAPAADASDKPPTLEEHNFDPVALADAQAKWLEKQVDKRVAAAMTGVQAKQASEAVRVQFESRVEAFAKAHSDFSTVVSNPALPALNSAAARSVALSEQGPAIIYHLGKNPDLAARISRMPVEQQLVQIGRLEAQLAPAAAPPPPATTTKPTRQKSVTSAPPPPAPVPAGSAVSKDPSTMSMDEWVRNERGRKIAERTERQKLRAAMR